MILRSRWADSVSDEYPWPEYPRPQLVRTQWVNLNGKWDASVHLPNEDPDFTSSILVPFPIGCLLYTSPSPRDATLSRMPSSA